MPFPSLLFGRLIVTFSIAAVSFVLIDGNAVGWVLWISIVTTVANFLIGDLLTLPRFGSPVTSLGEGVLAALGAYVLSLIFPPIRVTLFPLVLFGVLVGLGEFLLHKYLRESADAPL